MDAADAAAASPGYSLPSVAATCVTERQHMDLYDRHTPTYTQPLTDTLLHAHSLIHTRMTTTFKTPCNWNEAAW